MTHWQDKYLAALTVWREARCQSVEGKRAVLHVILNRVADQRWPSTAARVVLQRLQFSCHNRNDPNAVLLPSPDDTAWQECCALLEEPGRDTTDGANHYHTVSVDPPWADPSRITCRIGSHVFYRL